MAFRGRNLLAGLAIGLTAVAASAQPETSTVFVSNTNMVVNGDTTTIATLIATPGPDGISFLEAFRAANNTDGLKVITFSESLAGQTIEVTPTADIRQFVVSIPDLTIDGDTNGDEKPDITLQASNALMLFVIRDSRFALRNVRLMTAFTGVMITTMCTDLFCRQQELDGLTISGNDIWNNAGSGIELSPGVVRSNDLTFLPQLTYKNVVISKNNIQVRDLAIALTPSVDGVNGSLVQNVTIADNVLVATSGIRVVAADRAAPPFFGENNLIEGLTIDGNTFETKLVAVSISAGVQGNSNNRITNVQITGNTIGNPNSGIDIAAASDPKPQRVSSGNVIEHVVIAQNDIIATARGVTISGADLPVLQAGSIGFDSNAIRDVNIHDNRISGYSEAGVRLWGGLGNLSSGELNITRNRIDGVTVANNILTAGSHRAVGIAVVGGESRPGTLVRDNVVRGIRIFGNTISGNATGVLFAGGIGGNAIANVVDVAMFDGNVFGGNDVRVATTENSANASGNAVRFQKRRAVR